MSAKIVYLRLVEILAEDNGCTFKPTQEHYDRARPHVQTLLDAGYFQDDPYDLNGSFWRMAAGEELEAAAFFGTSPEAYWALSEILEDIFDGPIEELP